MRKVTLLFLGLLAAAAGAASPESPAPPPGEPAKPWPEVRELYVPMEALNVLLESGPRRVLLSRKEYDDLLTRARKTAESRAPRQALLVAADYQVAVAEQRATLGGTLHVAVLEDGLCVVPLELGSVGLLAAQLDDKPAPIGRADDGRLLLFVEGKGRHKLELDMVAPLQTTAARQILTMVVPAPPASTMSLAVPGDVELKGGAPVVSRTFDQAKGETRIRLLPQRGPMSLVMTLNSRLLRRERLVVARSVLVDEVTRAAEHFQATVSMDVLHMAVDRFRFAVPAGFEITEVASPHLSHWAISDEADRARILEVFLREETTDTILLSVSAIRTAPRLEDWQFPRFEAIDAAGHMAVVGLLVEDRLKAEGLAPEGLIPIDVAVLGQAALPSAERAAGEANPARPVVAYYAPQAAYGLAARFVKPPAEVFVTTNVLLMLEDSGQKVHGAFAVLPEEEKLFALDFAAEAGWQVTAVTDEAMQPLAFERYDAPYDEAGASRIHVRFPQGVPFGKETRIFFRASLVPADWLADWTARTVTLPVFAVRNATRDIGAVAVLASDDMTARPEAVENLTWLDENEMARYGLAGVAANLAYRYDAHPYSARLAVERRAPRMTARTASFFRVGRDKLTARYELSFDILEARTRELVFELPASTPEDASIRGCGDVVVKESTSELIETDGPRRRWTAHLAERVGSTVRLAVDLEQPLGGVEHKALPLPVVRALGVEYQSGLVCVEGDAELDVNVLPPHPRRVDVGELADAEYQPGRRLLGVFSFVGDAPPMAVDVARRAALALPSAIVQQAELTTVLSADGLSQTAAVFRLRTKAQFMKILLPPGSQFWSATLDGMPTKPQRDADSLLVSLSTTVPDRAAGLRELLLVYQTPVSRLGLWTEGQMLAPRLTVHAGPGSQGAEVPMADLLWHVHLPTGYRAVRSEGSVVSDELKPPALALAILPAALAKLSGGIDPSGGALGQLCFPTLRASKSGARSTAMRGGGSITMDDDDFAKGERPEGRSRSSHSIGHLFTDAAPSNAPATANEDKSAEPPAADDEWVYKNTPKETPPHASVTTVTGSGEVGVVNGEPPPSPDVGAVLAPATPSAGQRVRRGDLLGVRGLPITIAPDTPPITFTNLGAEPRLALTVVDSRRVGALAWGLALAVLVFGLARTGRSAGRKTAYVVTVALAATLVPVVSGRPELALMVNASFYAACLLVPWYLLAALVRRLCAWRRGCCGASAGAALVLAAAVVLGAAGGAAAAEPAAKGSPSMVIIPDPPPSFWMWDQLLPPVKIPDDAIVVPYDAEAPGGAAKADRLLVPYDKFLELWTLANPAAKAEDEGPPAPYAMAGAAWSATLAGDDFLLLDGHVEVDVFTDGYVAVTLPIAGGVLAKADCDGKPARLGIGEMTVQIENDVQANAPNDQARRPARQSQQAQQIRPAPNVVRLPQAWIAVAYVSGKGRHRLDLQVRMKLERRGGWRVAEGRLPAAAATSLELRVPDAATEVRLAGVRDRQTYETTAAGETIRTALDAANPLAIQWRPKVAEAEVDRGLTAESSASVDIREDRVGVAWSLTLGFRRSQREFFSIELPEGYLVEKVEGTNVRGWQVSREAGRQKLEVSLLKQAKESEQFTVHMWRPQQFAGPQATPLAVPVVEVTGAVRHSGWLTIRRSPLLDLRVLQAEGAARTDLPDEVTRQQWSLAGGESPLGLRAWQSYRFAATPFTVRLEAVPVEAKAEAVVQTLLKIAERERTLESRVTVNVQKRTLYAVRLFIPEDLKLQEVLAPGAFEWAVSTADATVAPPTTRLLTVYLATGQVGEVPIVLRGRLGELKPMLGVDVPTLAVLDVARQEGDIVVQVDPAFDVRLDRQARGLESLPLGRAYGWLAGGQRELARLALHYKEIGYAGRLVLSPRTPTVNCYTVTNVHVSDRALEETILLSLSIQGAGIREVAFLLPESMRGARVRVPGLRVKTVDDGPKGTVRVRLELQDTVMGELRVLVENDRLLTAEKHDAPIPIVETGTTDYRYVALESAGRDEVVVETTEGVERLSRQQRQWRRVADLLRGGMTQAYLVSPGAEAPRLAFTTRQRATVETAGARIGLAQTFLVLDASGAYRGQVIYYVDNRTEPYLEIELPKGARLWTAMVQGQPVKPVPHDDKARPHSVLIPLLKTVPGDLEYPVVLKYAGRMTALGALESVGFPLVRTVNINVELSQVELHVPENYTWFDFGGTMTPLTEEGDVAAGYVDFVNGQVRRLLEVAAGDNKFAQYRAQSNLKSLEAQRDAYAEFNDLPRQMGNEALRQNWDTNKRLFEQAEQQRKEQEKTERQTDQSFTNAGAIAESYTYQKIVRDRNIVQDAGSNFSYDAGIAPEGDKAGKSREVTAEDGGRFNAEWLATNRLQILKGPTTGETTAPEESREARDTLSQSRRSRTTRVQPKAADVSQLVPDQQSGKMTAKPQGQAQPSAGRQDVTQQYKQKLELEAQQQQEQFQALREVARQGRSADAGAAGGDERDAQGRAVTGTQAYTWDGTRVDADEFIGHGIGITLSSTVEDLNAALEAERPAGLASLLDVRLPQRGRVYRFSTPRGEVEITARAVSVEFLESLKRVVAVIVAVAAALWIRRIVRRGSLGGRAARVLSTLLIVAGALGFLFGLMPWAGLAALLAGIVWKVAMAVARRRTAAAVVPA